MILTILLTGGKNAEKLCAGWTLGKNNDVWSASSSKYYPAIFLFGAIYQFSHFKTGAPDYNSGAGRAAIRVSSCMTQKGSLVKIMR